MLKTAVALTLLLSAGAAAAQEAHPEKSAENPWTVDPRCAVMAAHMYNQGALTGACLAQEAAKAFVNPTAGYHPSQSQSQRSVMSEPPRRPRPQED